MKLFRFFGGLYFTLFLIGSTAVFVAAGTFLESKTGSHLYASRFTYSNPVFLILLGGYFVNILFSALSRYPYKKKHLPFLLTHLGMLLLLTGTFIKAFYGLQGNMRVLEGGTTDTVLLPETHALQIYTPSKQEQLILSKKLTLQGNSSLQIDLVGFAPNSEAIYETWIKDGSLFIDGLKPLPLKVESKELIPVKQVRMRSDPQSLWNLYAYKTENPTLLRNRIKQEAALPALVFCETSEGTEVAAINSDKTEITQIYARDRPKKLVVYDQGYGGYRAFFQFDDLTLETPLLCRCLPKSTHEKIEELRPQLTVRVRSEKKAEFITLPFERQGDGLKWPVLEGTALLRFQPKQQKIPYQIKLKQARQITYPHSAQPFSYEADVEITSKAGGEKVTKTLSMNHVYETSEGYRFYLANMTPLEEGSVKEIHLVVNRDPAKYSFTYPGAILMSIGIFLLFWWNPYKTKL